MEEAPPQHEPLPPFLGGILNGAKTRRLNRVGCQDWECCAGTTSNRFITCSSTFVRTHPTRFQGGLVNAVAPLQSWRKVSVASATGSGLQLKRRWSWKVRWDAKWSILRSGKSFRTVYMYTLPLNSLGMLMLLQCTMYVLIDSLCIRNQEVQ